MSDIQQARGWADDMRRVESACGGVRQDALAAAELIQSLPDQWVDAEKLKAIIADMDHCLKMKSTTDFSKGIDNATTSWRDALKALINPKLPTLADMSLEELQAYVGEDVTVDGWANPSMLVAVVGDEGAVLGHRWTNPWPFVEVRPLSDLTPVAAPEREAEDTPEPLLPRPEDVPAGEPWIVRYEREEWVGVRANADKVPWHIISMDGLDCRDVEDSEIALMPRLVPEDKP